MSYGLYVEKSEKLGKFDIPGKDKVVTIRKIWLSGKETIKVYQRNKNQAGVEI